MKSEPITDITTLDDVQMLVDVFYERVRADALLGPIFNDKIGNRWPEHLAQMYRFWQTVLLEEHTYFGAPFPPHAQLPVSAEHFERWLAIFYCTVASMFIGEKAEKAVWQGQRMAEMFHSKIEYRKAAQFRQP